MRQFPVYLVTRADDGAISRGPATLSEADLPPGEVLIAVEWSSVNYKDALVTTPGNRVARLAALVPGVDLAGTVVESGDPALAVGTAVLAHGGDLGVARHGGFAAYARVPADQVLTLPAGLSARQAMIMGTAGFTAALSVDRLQAHGLVPRGGTGAGHGGVGRGGLLRRGPVGGPGPRGGGQQRQERGAGLAGRPGSERRHRPG
jgi:putative YhdH/YhfP family quinone oxidoreductase